MLCHGWPEMSYSWRYQIPAIAAAGFRVISISNFYWQYFQKPGVAESELERDVDLTMRTLLGHGFSNPSALSWKTAKDFLAMSARQAAAGLAQRSRPCYFCETYRKTGFRGGLNWYRNMTATGNRPHRGKGR